MWDSDIDCTYPALSACERDELHDIATGLKLRVRAALPPNLDNGWLGDEARIKGGVRMLMPLRERPRHALPRYDEMNSRRSALTRAESVVHKP